MSLNTKHSYKLSVKRARRGIRRRQQRRTIPSLKCRAKRSFFKSMEIEGKLCNKKSKLSEKFEALKKLIPAHSNGEIVKPDQLFKETADYIVLLRTRLVILQKLIEFYGNHNDNNNNSENGNAVLL